MLCVRAQANGVLDLRRLTQKEAAEFEPQLRCMARNLNLLRLQLPNAAPSPTTTACVAMRSTLQLNKQPTAQHLNCTTFSNLYGMVRQILVLLIVLLIVPPISMYLYLLLLRFCTSEARVSTAARTTCCCLFAPTALISSTN
jgi:hypothetical protein